MLIQGQSEGLPCHACSSTGGLALGMSKCPWDDDASGGLAPARPGGLAPGMTMMMRWEVWPLGTGIAIYSDPAPAQVCIPALEVTKGMLFGVDAGII